MQKSARCRGLWWFKYSFTCTFSVRNNSHLHTSMLSNEKTQMHPSCQSSTREQELSDCTMEEQYLHTEELRQRNCWKLWHLRGLSVEEISSILHMRQDTIINIILSFERKRENVDWRRLCKLVTLTTSVAQAILVARSKAKGEMPSLRGATLFSASDIKNFCSQNVTNSHICLVHMMLGQKLTSSEILDLANFTEMDFKGTYQAEATDLNSQSGEESVDFLSPISIAQHDKASECDRVAVHKNYVVSSQITSLGANGCLEEKDTAAFRYMAYDSEGARSLGFHHQVPVLKQKGKLSSSDGEQEDITDSRSVNAVTEQKLVTMFDIVLWLRNNRRATISNIVTAFGYCETKHLLFLILEMLESSIIVEQEGMLRIASEQSSSRSEELTKSSQALFNPSINRRMHRALCLKAVVLNVVIHKPRMNVEFVVRHIKVDDESPVYYVQICKCPSCTCPDFVAGLKAELDYMPCKHLFYVYLVQLHLDKSHEHLMLQRSLKEEDLEKILEGHY